MSKQQNTTSIDIGDLLVTHEPGRQRQSSAEVDDIHYMGEDLLRQDAGEQTVPREMMGEKPPDDVNSSNIEGPEHNLSRLDYIQMLSEDRMGARIKNADKSSLVRYTWCVWELFKTQQHRTFSRNDIIDAIDKTGLCDQKTRDRPSMMKRLGRVLDVLHGLELIGTGTDKTQLRWSYHQRFEEYNKNPTNLYSFLAKKSRIKQEIESKKQKLQELEKQKENLNFLIARNKKPVSFKQLKPTTSGMTGTNVGPEPVKLSLEGCIMLIPRSPGQEVSFSSEDSTSLRVLSKSVLPRYKPAWTILDKFVNTNLQHAHLLQRSNSNGQSSICTTSLLKNQ